MVALTIHLHYNQATILHHLKSFEVNHILDVMVLKITRNQKSNTEQEIKVQFQRMLTNLLSLWVIVRATVSFNIQQGARNICKPVH